MDVERETIIEVGVAVAAVGAFVVVLLLIGELFGDGLHGAGALAVVASMTAFVLLMAIVGYWFSNQDY